MYILMGGYNTLLTIDTYDKTKLLLTRGDDGYVELPIFQKVLDKSSPEKYRYTKYLVQPEDTVRVQVRREPVVDQSTSTSQTLIFSGEIEIRDGVPVWHITHEQSAIDCDLYYWDVQIIMGNGIVSTYNSGLLQIMPEVTV